MPRSAAARLKVKIEATEILGSETIIHARLASGERFTLAQRGISGAKAGDDVPLDAARRPSSICSTTRAWRSVPRLTGAATM